MSNNMELLLGQIREQTRAVEALNVPMDIRTEMREGMLRAEVWMHDPVMFRKLLAGEVEERPSESGRFRILYAESRGVDFWCAERIGGSHGEDDVFRQ